MDETIEPGDDRPDLRCAVVTARLGEPAAGTASVASRFVLAELAAPWPKPITAHPELAGVDPALLDSGAGRVLAIGRRTDDPARLRRVITYERPPGSAGAMSGREALVAPGRIADAVTAALHGEAPGEPVDSDTVDLLICTQGTHDRCCGRHGTLLHLAVDGTLGEHVRTWRTSHTGGHRFAPTGLTFPDAMTWAGLDTEVVSEVTRRDGPTDHLLAHVRGCASITDRPAQIVDAHAFASVGWSWLAGERRWMRTDGADHVEVVLTHSSGRRFEASLEAGEAIPVPPCGRDLVLATKTAPQWRLRDLVGLVIDR